MYGWHHRKIKTGRRDVACIGRGLLDLSFSVTLTLTLIGALLAVHQRPSTAVDANANWVDS